MQGLPVQNLSIEWVLPNRSHLVKSWFEWQKLELSQSIDDTYIEQNLNLADGTMAILRQAFELGLSRFQGWAPPNRTVEQKFYDAARIFRRGVAAEGEQTSTHSGQYEIQFCQDSGPLDWQLDQNAFYVLDRVVCKCWQETWMPPLERSYICDASELGKTMLGAANMAKKWRSVGKPDHWIIIGGGVVADMAAFTADLCGCSFTLVPTTLLAMVDACVGGKTGVNFPPYGKNQVGTFAFPKQVKIWLPWLKTLPLWHLRSGVAECIKHAMLTRDFSLVEKLADHIIAGNLEQLAPQLPALVQLKAEVIHRDPMELGERAILNFGHTLGHAIESYSQNSTVTGPIIPHGYAVAYGMAFAVMLSEKKHHYPRSSSDRLWQALRKVELISDCQGFQEALGISQALDETLARSLYKYIKLDKKNDSETSLSRWILLDARGRVGKDSGGQFGTSLDEATFLSEWKRFIERLG